MISLQFDVFYNLEIRDGKRQREGESKGRGPKQMDVQTNETNDLWYWSIGQVMVMLMVAIQKVLLLQVMLI